MTKEEAIKDFEHENDQIIEEIQQYGEFQHLIHTLSRNQLAISALKGGWIPIESEEKPEDYDRVLITVKGVRGLIVREAEWHGRQNEFEVLHNHERWEVGEKGLLAWQPLPEPYKKELSREQAINEWLKTHCNKCEHNLDCGTGHVNCQIECEVQKDIGVACIHYEEKGE